MKKQILKVIAFFSIITLVASCGKDNIGAKYKQQISLLVDGVPFSVTTGGADVEEADAHIRADTVFQLDAEKGDKDFSINFNKIIGSGTYTINKNNYSLFNYAQWEDGDDLFTNSGGSNKSRLIFTITNIAGSASDHLRYIEGTFYGVLYNISQTDSVIITNGQISIIE